MPRKKKKANEPLTMKVNGNPTPFARVQFCQNLPVEYDPKIDIYKGEIIVHPSPINLHDTDLHPDGSIRWPYGTEVDFEFGADATIRGKVLNLRGRLRLIEVGMKVGDVLHDAIPAPKAVPDVTKEEVESFASNLPVVEGMIV